jgi:hypothetical protein
MLAAHTLKRLERQGMRSHVPSNTYRTEQLLQGLDSEIVFTQQRFIAAMEARLPHMLPEQKERYFAVLSALVAKLEDPQKSLRDILQEMMSEAAGLVLSELQAGR